MKIQKLVLQCYHSLRLRRKTLQTSLLLLSIIVLLFCKQISGYFANYNPEYWFDYFIITERFSMLLLLLSVCEYLKSKNRLVTELLLFFLLQDFLDRVFFDICEWSLNDTIVIMLLILQFIIRKYVKINK